jgi:hypothetical protein
MRIGREAWILAALLLLFIAASTYYSRRGEEDEQRGRPTTFSAGRNGLAALFKLCEREGLRAQRLENDIHHVPDGAGLIVISEPFTRPISAEEESSLAEWVDQGGALLYLIHEGSMTLGTPDPENPKKTDYTVQAEFKQTRPADLAIGGSASPYLKDVSQIHVDGAQRLAPTSPDKQKALVKDADGAYAVAWTQGKGNVVVALDTLGADNARLSQADNALFFLNVAAAHTTAKRPLVLFDEYHQGFGSEGETRGLWDAVGGTTRGIVWYALAVFALLVYNANRRFGTAKRIPIPTYRPSTEYIESMARLFRRADAGDIAIETVYKAFARDLAKRLDSPPDARLDDTTALAERRLGWDRPPLRELLNRCDAVLHGEKIGEPEMLKIARQIEDYRRKADLVRPV